MAKPEINWQEILLKLEAAVVRGENAEVQASFENIPPRSVPREFACKLAELAWRVSLPLAALKILHPLVYPENKFLQKANDKEKTFYCAALINLGATFEATQIANSIDSQVEPEVLLIQSFAYFKTWNYQPSVALLQKYLEHPNLSSYKKLLGKVNLAAAWICLFKLEPAQALLTEIQAECERGQYLLLLGNCFELRAQIDFFKRDFDAALPWLEKSLELLKNQDGDFSLYADKWRIISRCIQNPSVENLQDLQKVRERARSILNWETLRECDLFESIATHNDELLKKLIHGSPFEYYRKRARQLTAKTISTQGEYHWTLGSNTAHTKQIFNPYEKQAGAALFDKPMLLALFDALTKDFYKPSNMGLLFQNIYKNEEFNPDTTPDRILKLIKRLNLWFAEHAIQLRVIIKKSEFSLAAPEGAQVQIIIRPAVKLSKTSGSILQLKKVFQERNFTEKKSFGSLGNFTILRSEFTSRSTCCRRNRENRWRTINRI